MCLLSMFCMLVRYCVLCNQFLLMLLLLLLFLSSVCSRVEFMPARACGLFFKYSFLPFNLNPDSAF